MANVKFASKKIIAIFAVFLLLFGGAGGFLLWRINQEKTVAPTDSDAAQIDNCLDNIITVDFSPYYKTAPAGKGYIKVKPGLHSPAVTYKEDWENGRIRLFMNNSCAKGIPIEAIGSGDAKFLYWEEVKTGKKYRANPIIVRREHSKGVAEEPVFKESGSLVARFGACKEVSVGYLHLSSAEGKLVVRQKRGLVQENTKDNVILQTFKTRDEKGSQIEAVPNKGFKFKHWVTISNDVVSTNPVIQKDAVDVFKDKECVEASYSLMLTAVYEKDGSGETPVDRRAKVIYQAQPTECTKMLVCASPEEARLTSDKAKGSCLNQEASPNEHVMPISVDPKLGPECVFQYWTLQLTSPEGLKNAGQKDSSDLRRHDRAGAAGTTKTITAVFKKGGTTPPTDQTYSLRYSTEGNGKLSKDGGAPSSNTVAATIKAGESGPSVKAVPNTGYVFAYWIDNSTREKDTSSLATANPRQDTNVKGNISLTAHYEKSGGTTPPDGGDITPPSSGGITPPSSGAKDGLPGTSASPSKSLYIIFVGTLVLSLGMLLPYLPSKSIIKKKKEV